MYIIVILLFINIFNNFIYVINIIVCVYIYIYIYI